MVRNHSMVFFDCVHTPNLTTNELVSQVDCILKSENGAGFRLGYNLGMILGYFAEVVAKLTCKILPVSTIKVKKFVSSTEFHSAQNVLIEFDSPFELNEGEERTLKSGFVATAPKIEIFTPNRRIYDPR